MSLVQWFMDIGQAARQKSASGANNFNDAVITTAFFTPNTGGNNAIQ